VSEKNKDTGGAEILRKAWRMCRRHVLFVALFSAGLNLLYLAPSLYMLQVYDRVLASGSVLTLLYLSAVLLGALGVLAFLDAMRVRLLVAMSRRFDRVAAPSVLLAALQRDGRAAAGKAQALREFDTLRTAVSGPPALAALDAPWTPIYIAVCFLIHPWIGCLALVGGALLLAVAYANQVAMHKSLRASDQSAGAMYALHMADSAQGDTARALGMQNNLVQRQLRARRAMSDAINQSGRIGALFASSTKFARLVLQSAALGLGAYLAVNQQISAGGIIAASILSSRAFAPLELIVGAWRQFEQGRQAYGVINRMLKTQDQVREHTALPGPQGSLAVEHVSVRAPNSDRMLLTHASFQASPGDIIGVIGPSGAGKTTLLRAIAGAIEPDDGAVRLDGAKLSDWEPARLGAFVGYLPQEVGLFSGTIAENISRFSQQPRDEIAPAIIAAAQAAAVHELILTLPQGYDTEIGQGGRGLSAGQAQRIGLARALYGDPVLIALDEPNAHLDGDGETALMNALRAASERGACSVLVAHRTGLVNVANKIMVVREGRIEAFGPREQVMARIGPGPRPVPSPNETSGVRP
jgi:ATP-binding cassette subfamily C protein